MAAPKYGRNPLASRLQSAIASASATLGNKEKAATETGTTLASDCSLQAVAASTTAPAESPRLRRAVGTVSVPTPTAPSPSDVAATVASRWTRVYPHQTPSQRAATEPVDQTAAPTPTSASPAPRPPPSPAAVAPAPVEAAAPSQEIYWVNDGTEGPAPMDAKPTPAVPFSDAASLGGPSPRPSATPAPSSSTAIAPQYHAPDQTTTLESALADLARQQALIARIMSVVAADCPACCTKIMLTIAASDLPVPSSPVLCPGVTGPLSPLSFETHGALESCCRATGTDRSARGQRNNRLAVQHKGRAPGKRPVSLSPSETQALKDTLDV